MLSTITPNYAIVNLFSFLSGVALLIATIILQENMIDTFEIKAAGNLKFEA